MRLGKIAEHLGIAMPVAHRALADAEAAAQALAELVLEPDDGLIGIGSGGSFALSAARALIDVEGLEAEDIARKAMSIAAGICIYTNDKLTIESL